MFNTYFRSHINIFYNNSETLNFNLTFHFNSREEEYFSPFLTLRPDFNNEKFVTKRLVFEKMRN